MNTPLGLADGVRAFTEGWTLCRTPQLKRYIWLPRLLSLVIVATGLYFGIGYLGRLAEWLTAGLPEWLDFLEAVLKPLFYLIGTLVSAWHVQCRSQQDITHIDSPLQSVPPGARKTSHHQLTCHCRSPLPFAAARRLSAPRRRVPG